MTKKIRHPYIIDVEASGFGHDSYPIEVGIALDDDSRFCTLISPYKDWHHWDEEAERTHGITRDQLDLHGKSVFDVACTMNELLRGLTLFTDGWVVDKPWLSKLFFAANEPMQFHVSPLEMILSDAQMQKWHETKDKILAENKLPRHRASSDAWLIQQTFKQTLD